MHKMLPFINETWLFSFFCYYLEPAITKEWRKKCNANDFKCSHSICCFIFVAVLFSLSHTTKCIDYSQCPSRFFSLCRKFCSKLQLSDKNCFALFQNHFECKEKQWQKKIFINFLLFAIAIASNWCSFAIWKTLDQCLCVWEYSIAAVLSACRVAQPKCCYLLQIHMLLIIIEIEMIFMCNVSHV